MTTSARRDRAAAGGARPRRRHAEAGRVLVRLFHRPSRTSSGCSNSENLHRARHLSARKRIREMHSPLVEMISRILQARPDTQACFAAASIPVQLYISIAALGYFYFANIHTLSTIFGRDLRRRGCRRNAAPRRRHGARLSQAVKHGQMQLCRARDEPASLARFPMTCMTVLRKRRRDPGAPAGADGRAQARPAPPAGAQPLLHRRRRRRARRRRPHDAVRHPRGRPLRDRAGSSRRRRWTRRAGRWCASPA